MLGCKRVIVTVQERGSAGCAIMRLRLPLWLLLLPVLPCALPRVPLVTLCQIQSSIPPIPPTNHFNHLINQPPNQPPNRPSRFALSWSAWLGAAASTRLRR